MKWSTVNKIVIVVSIWQITLENKDILESISTNNQDPVELNEFLKSVLKYKNAFKMIRHAARNDISPRRNRYAYGLHNDFHTPVSQIESKRSLKKHQEKRKIDFFKPKNGPLNDIFPHIYQIKDNQRSNKYTKKRQRRELDENKVEVIPLGKIGYQKVEGEKVPTPLSLMKTDSLLTTNRRKFEGIFNVFSKIGNFITQSVSANKETTSISKETIKSTIIPQVLLDYGDSLQRKNRIAFNVSSIEPKYFHPNETSENIKVECDNNSSALKSIEGLSPNEFEAHILKNVSLGLNLTQEQNVVTKSEQLNNTLENKNLTTNEKKGESEKNITEGKPLDNPIPLNLNPESSEKKLNCKADLDRLNKDIKNNDALKQFPEIRHHVDIEGLIKEYEKKELEKKEHQNKKLESDDYKKRKDNNVPEFYHNAIDEFKADGKNLSYKQSFLPQEEKKIFIPVHKYEPINRDGFDEPTVYRESSNEAQFGKNIIRPYTSYKSRYIYPNENYLRRSNTFQNHAHGNLNYQSKCNLPLRFPFRRHAKLFNDINYSNIPFRTSINHNRRRRNTLLQNEADLNENRFFSRKLMSNNITLTKKPISKRDLDLDIPDVFGMSREDDYKEDLAFNSDSTTDHIKKRTETDYGEEPDLSIGKPHQKHTKLKAVNIIDKHPKSFEDNYEYDEVSTEKAKKQHYSKKSKSVFRPKSVQNTNLKQNKHRQLKNKNLFSKYVKTSKYSAKRKSRNSNKKRRRNVHIRRHRNNYKPNNFKMNLNRNDYFKENLKTDATVQANKLNEQLLKGMAIHGKSLADQNNQKYLKRNTDKNKEHDDREERRAMGHGIKKHKSKARPKKAHEKLFDLLPPNFYPHQENYFYPIQKYTVKDLNTGSMSNKYLRNYKNIVGSNPLQLYNVPNDRKLIDTVMYNYRNNPYYACSDLNHAFIIPHFKSRKLMSLNETGSVARIKRSILEDSDGENENMYKKSTEQNKRMEDDYGEEPDLSIGKKVSDPVKLKKYNKVQLPPKNLEEQYEYIEEISGNAGKSDKNDKLDLRESADRVKKDTKTFHTRQGKHHKNIHRKNGHPKHINHKIKTQQVEYNDDQYDLSTPSCNSTHELAESESFSDYGDTDIVLRPDRSNGKKFRQDDINMVSAFTKSNTLSYFSQSHSWPLATEHFSTMDPLLFSQSNDRKLSNLDSSTSNLIPSELISTTLPSKSTKRFDIEHSTEDIEKKARELENYVNYKFLNTLPSSTDCNVGTTKKGDETIKIFKNTEPKLQTSTENNNLQGTNTETVPIKHTPKKTLLPGIKKKVESRISKIKNKLTTPKEHRIQKKEGRSVANEDDNNYQRAGEQERANKVADIGKGVDIHFAKVLIDNVLAKVNSNKNLKMKIGNSLNKKRIYETQSALQNKNVFSQKSNPESVDVQSLLSSVTNVLNKLVHQQIEQKLCERLPPQLMEFLKRIVYPDKYNLPNGHDDSYHEDTFLFKSPSGETKVNSDTKMQLENILEKLQEQYNALDEYSKHKAQPISDYINEHLDMLRNIEIEDNSYEKYKQEGNISGIAEIPSTNEWPNGNFEREETPREAERIQKKLDSLESNNNFELIDSDKFKRYEKKREYLESSSPSVKEESNIAKRDDGMKTQTSRQYRKLVEATDQLRKKRKNEKEQNRKGDSYDENTNRLNINTEAILNENPVRNNINQVAFESPLVFRNVD